MKNLSFDALLFACILPHTATYAAPTETVTPTQNHPNSTVTVSGTAFDVSEAVDLFLDTADDQLAITDATGKFPAPPLQVPASAQPGTHYITAIGRHTGLAAQKTFTVATNWAKLGFGQQNPWVNPYENTLSPANVPGLDLLWTFTTGDAIYATPTLYNGRLFVGSYGHKLYALNAATGSVLWSATIGGSIYGDYFWGDSPDGFVKGLEAYLGPAVGVTGSAQFTYTIIDEVISWPN